MTPPYGLRSMATQMFVILLAGVVAAAALAFAGASLVQRQAEQRGRIQRVADRVADLKAALDGAPASVRADLFGVGPEAPRLADLALAPGEPDEALSERLSQRLGPRARVAAFDPPDEACRPPPPTPPGPPRADGPATAAPPRPPPPPAGGAAPKPPPPGCRRVDISLLDGERVALVIPTGPKTPPAERSPLGPVFVGVLGAAAAALAFVVSRLATAPLSRLSKAAAALGHDLDRPPLKIEGPSEVREAAAAFNAMQVRLKQHVAERTQMLAAITHDLQTPLTRQRLRLEKVGDRDLRDHLLADQAAMQEMIRDGLDLARLSSEVEALEELDVDSLLQALCDDAAAAGHQVSISGETGLAVRTRPLALRRSLSNLLDNALKYGQGVTISARRDQGIAIRVSDRGPGIPPEKLEAVLQPFYRLETSRSRATGGVGLGLTIAKMLAERAGGRLYLANAAGGGLQADVRFPWSDQVSAAPVTGDGSC